MPFIVIVFATITLPTCCFAAPGDPGNESPGTDGEAVAIGRAPDASKVTNGKQPCAGLSQSDWASICADHEKRRYAFEPVEGGWQARNPGQQWTAKFDGRGFLTTPCEGDWTWGMELCSYGFGEKQVPVGARPPAVKAEGQRISYRWDAKVQEWWVNDQRGLEHGYVVHERPHGDASQGLSFLLATCGSLKPKLTGDALGVLFQDTSRATFLTYTGLKVWDADGRPLAAHFEMSQSQTPACNSQLFLRLMVAEQGARYPITIDPIAQQAYLKASNTGENDKFGRSVAISGDTVVIGAYQEDSSAGDSGAAYVFTRSAGVWSQQAYLKASNTGTGDNFGVSVAISGDTVVIGAWLEDSSATGANGNEADNSALNSGAAYVFIRSAGVWSQQAYLKASNTGAHDHFGFPVAISGDTIVVGARQEDSSAIGIDGNETDDSALNSGAAYVFARSAGVWSQQAYLKASNTGAGDCFGYPVAISGDTITVGAYLEDSNATGVDGNGADDSAADSGAAYVFARSAGVWSQQAYLKASNTAAGDWFGISVALSSDTVVVGSYLEDSNATGVGGNEADDSAGDSGAAYVFARSGEVWGQQAYIKASNTGAGDGFGRSVAISGNTLVVGADREDSNATGVNADEADNSAGDSGAAYVFIRSAGVWSQRAYLKASNTGAGDDFGIEVALAADTVVVGAFGEDSSTTGIDSAPDEGATDAGAAYLFTGVIVNQPPSFALPAGPIVAAGEIWTAHESDRDWSGIAMSADGSKLAAVVNGGLLYTSSDGGVTWTAQVAAGSRSWWWITSSADGSKLAAVDHAGPIFTSNDSGVSWTAQTAAGSRSWSWIASSADGAKLAAAVYAGPVYTSSDSGETWTARESDRNWVSITSSADGSRLAAVVENGRIHTSSDSGETWTARESDRYWISITSSADGSKLAAVDFGYQGNGGRIYTSSDGGETWTARESNRWWSYITSSADGSKLAAAVYGGPVYTSSDSGVTWTARAAAGNGGYWGIASSADGNKLAVVVEGGPIYISESFTVPYDVCVSAGSGPHTRPAYATEILAGPPDEQATQTVSFQVNNDTPPLFTGQPAIDPNGTLTFTPGLVPGTATVTVTATDDGGTANGGVDTSAPQTFTITVTSPEIALSGNSVDIANGDATPDTADHTDFGSTAVSGGTVARTFTIINRGTGDLMLTRTAPDYVVLSGAEASRFSVTTQPGSSTVAAGGGTQTFTVTFDPSATGTHTATVSIANNDADENPFAFAIQGKGLSNLESWRQQFFGTTSNTGDAANDATPQHDGLPNLLKFALGMNPTVTGVLPIALVKSGSTLEFIYPRSVGAMAECTFIVEWSDTLEAASWSSAGVTEQILSDNGTLQQVKASLPAGGNARFVCLRVDLMSD